MVTPQITLADYFQNLDDCDAGFGDNGPITVHSRSRVQDTPLHWAAINGDFDIAKLLIEAGADINARGENDYRPIHEAISHKHVDILNLLLQHDAECKTDLGGGDIEWMIEDHEEIHRLVNQYQQG